MSFYSLLDTFWIQIVEFATTTGIKLVLSILLLIVGRWLIKFSLRRLSESHAFSKMDPGARTFLRSFSSVVLMIILILTAASIIGVPLTSVMALLASAGLAVGLALQGALGNLAGGLIILIFKPFRVGDYIDTTGGSGTVEEINIFYTILVTPDNQKITLPNGSLTNSAIKNYSIGENRRLDLEISVAYDSDLIQVKKLLLDLAESHPAIHSEPAVFCRLLRNSDIGMVFALRAWTRRDRFWDTYHDLQESIKLMFDQNNIVIPSPVILPQRAK